MRSALVLAVTLAVLAACDDPPTRLTGLAERIPIDTLVPGDTTDIPGDTTGTPEDSARSAAEAATFLIEAAAILEAYSDPDDAFATFELAGGPGARGAIQPPPDSLPPSLCQNPRDPHFYARAQRGITYVWDPTRASYVFSTEPNIGCAIRITRYALAAGTPVVPLQRLGYIEVADLYSPGPASGIRFTVVSDTGTQVRTLTDYLSLKSYQYYTRAYTEDWDLRGYFDRNGDRFDFDFTQFTSSGTISGMSYHNVSGSSTFSGGGVVVSTTRSPTAYSVTVTRADRTVQLTLEKPTNSATFSGLVRTTGAWSYEGVVGRITGTPDEATFEDNTGGALPAAVEADLESFWASLLSMFGLHRWPHV